MREEEEEQRPLGRRAGPAAFRAALISTYVQSDRGGPRGRCLLLVMFGCHLSF